MKTTKCVKCQTDIKNQGYAKHEKGCNGSGPSPKFVKLVSCPHCSLLLGDLPTSKRANHVRWCMHNPKREQYVSTAISSGIASMQTAEAREKSANGIRQAYAEGKYAGVSRSHPGWNHSEESIAKIKEKALASKHRRLVRSIRNYIKLDGAIVKLDSSWEEALAIRLDGLGVKWVRPPAVEWIDEIGKSHNYFPDFYLIDYNLYLDPKNPYAIKSQQAKIKCLTTQLKNLIIIESLEDCKNFNIPL